MQRLRKFEEKCPKCGAKLQPIVKADISVIGSKCPKCGYKKERKVKEPSEKKNILY